MSDPDQVAAMREEYGREVLRRGNMEACPVAQFSRWFSQAREAEVDEPNTMILSTVDECGQPSSRAVLLKAYDTRGFVFYTNYKSSKAEQMAANPKVALNFLWLPIERQVRIEGTVEKVSLQESARYFMSRPKGSQVGAWVSEQSRVVSKRSLLKAKWNEMQQRFANGEVPVPDFWGGYRVVPTLVEFWQGGASRLHDRIRYRLVEGEWIRERLEP